MNKKKTTLPKSNGFFTGSDMGYAKTNPADVVLWDNGLHYTGSIRSVWDDLWPWESLGADDFQFEETTVVTDVHWMGGYWYPREDGDFDWNVSFYMDRGDGMAPGEKIYEEVFPNAMVHETFIEEIWNGWMFSYWVDLADAVTFTGGEKYWISIQGVGNYPPDSYWGCHSPLVDHVLVWKSPLDGVLDWTDCTELFYGNALDFSFQLTGDGEPVVPDLECEGYLQWDEVPTGSIVNGSFLIYNIGDVGSMLRWEVIDVPDWGSNWTLDWWGEDYYVSTDFGYVGTTSPEEILVEVTAPDDPNEVFEGEIVLINSDNPDDTCSINVILITPRSKTINNPFLQFLQSHPNLFPILQKLIQGFGL